MSNNTNNTTLQDLLYTYIQDPSNSESNFALALYYHNIGQTAAAISYYLRTAERSRDVTFQYEALIRASMCFNTQGIRGLSVRGLLQRAITLLPKRPEAYFVLSRWYEREQQVESWVNCFTLASLAESICDFNAPPLRTSVDYPGKYGILFEKAVSGWWVGLCDDAKDLFRDLLINYPLDKIHRAAVINNLKFMNQFVTKQIIPYKKEKHYRLHRQFPGSTDIEVNYSESYQDMFVLTMTNGKRNGTYLEIGSASPHYGNNTYLLESQFDWKGVSMDIDANAVKTFSDQRKNPCVLGDGLVVDFDSILTRHNMPKDIDYLQVDAEPPQTTLNILKRIPFDKYRFAVITFEHDAYAEVEDTVRQESRQFLASLGYVLIARNIAPDIWRGYEDWWVHPDLVSRDIRDKMMDVTEAVKWCEDYMFA